MVSGHNSSEGEDAPGDNSSGETRLDTENCSFTFKKLNGNALLVKIAGYDKGELGSAPLEYMAEELRPERQVELFIDASKAEGVAWDVSQSWTSWFRANKGRLSQVHILVRSKYVQQAIMVAKQLSRTAQLLQVYSDAEHFERLLKARI